MHELVELSRETVTSLETLLSDAIRSVRGRVVIEGHIVNKLFDRDQRATHGVAWLATTVAGARQLAAYAARMASGGTLGEVEELTVRVGLGEIIAQIAGGIPMSQSETARLSDFGLAADAVARLVPAVKNMLAAANTAANRARLAELLSGRQQAELGFDEILESVRDEMRKFADVEVAPYAQDWHRGNAIIPLDIISRMASMGVFGLTAPEQYGGMGLGKETMCVVSEELSRGAAAVGSLGAPAEIAAELILANGTRDQKERWLPKIASGDILPALAFAESNTDLATVQTRAARSGDTYKVHGKKTWVSHAARADVLLLLVRTNPKDAGQNGVSILLAEKPRGSDADPFPAKGISCTETETLGARGLKEYELAFDGFEVKAENLLGGVEGLGFTQLTQTSDSARIHAAAGAVGIAQAALDHAIGYVKSGNAGTRAGDKIAAMAADIMTARQLAHHAAREKDAGRRCDLDAGMAKLYAARTAWAAADGAVQIHGSGGIALASPVSRILCDARTRNILDGTEPEAQAIARRLLGGGN